MSHAIMWLIASMKAPCEMFSECSGLMICRPMSTADHARVTLIFLSSLTFTSTT